MKVKFFSAFIFKFQPKPFSTGGKMKITRNKIISQLINSRHATIQDSRCLGVKEKVHEENVTWTLLK